MNHIIRATKYKLIKDYIGYGYIDEKNTTLDKNEKEDVKLNTDILSSTST